MKKTSGRKRIIDPDNPPITAAQFKLFRPSRDVVPHIVESYLRSRGRPTEGETAKVQVTLRLDPSVIAHFKATGDGWQTRINEALVKAISGKSVARRR
jgi:uncharacterized protein (DUF4415 family)